MENRKIKLSKIQELINIPYKGKDLEIHGLNLCNRETCFSSILSYITDLKYIVHISNNTSVKAIFLNLETYNRMDLKKYHYLSFFICENPEEEFYLLHNKLYNETSFYEKYNNDTIIGENCKIHESAFIDSGVIIGDNVIIGPKTVILRGSIISDNVVIGSSAVVGAEGFQLIYDRFKIPHLIKHVGGVKIESNAYIGDLTNVCNALFEGYTFIGKNSKIDTHIHIAHNCIINENVVITSGTVLCGSSVLKNNVWIAPNSTILNRVVVKDGAFVGLMSCVLKDVEENQMVYGVPARVKQDGIK